MQEIYAVFFIRNNSIGGIFKTREKAEKFVEFYPKSEYVIIPHLLQD